MSGGAAARPAHFSTSESAERLGGSAERRGDRASCGRCAAGADGVGGTGGVIGVDGTLAGASLPFY